jgi:hypothetical protein
VPARGTTTGDQSQRHTTNTVAVTPTGVLNTGAPVNGVFSQSMWAAAIRVSANP